MFWSVTLVGVLRREKRRRLKQTGFDHVNGAFMSSSSQRTYAHGPNQPLTLAFDKKLTGDFDKELPGNFERRLPGDVQFNNCPNRGIWIELYRRYTECRFATTLLEPIR